MSLAATIIKNAIVARLTAQLPAEVIAKSRQTPMAETVRRMLNVRVAGFNSEMFTQGGSVEWTVTIEITAMSRDGDDDSENLLGLAHAALIQEPRDFGVGHLYLDPAFSATTDTEDQADDMAAIAGLYSCTITTEDSHAS